MTTPSLTEVVHAGVTAMDLTDRPIQSIGRLRDRDQMDMIGLQAVRPDLDVVQAAPLGHERQAALVIFVRKERLLSAVSALCDVMRQTGCDNSCQSSHGRRPSSPRRGVKNRAWRRRQWTSRIKWAVPGISAALAGLLVVERVPGCKLAVSVLDLPEAGSKRRPMYGPIPGAGGSRPPGSGGEPSRLRRCRLLAGWNRSAEPGLAMDDWGEFGLSRFSASRGLDTLERVGLISLLRDGRAGRLSSRF